MVAIMIDDSVELESVMYLNDNLKGKLFVLLCVEHQKSYINFLMGEEVEDKIHINQFSNH